MTNKIVWLEHPSNNNWECAYIDGRLIGHYSFSYTEGYNTKTSIYIGSAVNRQIIEISAVKASTEKLKKTARDVLEAYYMSLEDESLAS